MKLWKLTPKSPEPSLEDGPVWKELLVAAQEPEEAMTTTRNWERCTIGAGTAADQSLYDNQEVGTSCERRPRVVAIAEPFEADRWPVWTRIKRGEQ